jgi:hypothetical protein
MSTYRQRTIRNETADDVGTLWTMRRTRRAARCALIALTNGWELRVLVDGETMMSRRCARPDEAFALASRWKQRMLDEGWTQVVPQAGVHLS